MKVSIKNFSIDMEIKNTGIEIDISDNDERHLGDLFVTKTQLVWCPGKTQKDNGKKITWQEFIKYMENDK